MSITHIQTGTYKYHFNLLSLKILNTLRNEIFYTVAKKRSPIERQAQVQNVAGKINISV